MLSCVDHFVESNASSPETRQVIDSIIRNWNKFIPKEVSCIIVEYVSKQIGVISNSEQSCNVNWKICATEKFLKYTIGKSIESDKFECCKLQWHLKIYPNGGNRKSLGLSNLYLYLDRFPSNIKLMTIHYSLRCKETDSCFKPIATLKENDLCGGWSNRCQLLSEFKDMFDLGMLSEINFECSINILRIINNSDEIIYNYPIAILHEQPYHFSWVVDHKLMQLFKNSYHGKRFASATSSNKMWCLRCYPNGRSKEQKGNVRLYLQLCSLPMNISKIKVRFQLICYSTNTVFEDKQFFSYDNNSTKNGLPTNKLLMEQFTEIDDTIFTAKIDIIEMYDMLNNLIYTNDTQDQDWMQYILRQASVTHDSGSGGGGGAGASGHINNHNHNSDGNNTNNPIGGNINGFPPSSPGSVYDEGDHGNNNHNNNINNINNNGGGNAAEYEHKFNFGPSNNSGAYAPSYPRNMGMERSVSRDREEKSNNFELNEFSNSLSNKFSFVGNNYSMKSALSTAAMPQISNGSNSISMSLANSTDKTRKTSRKSSAAGTSLALNNNDSAFPSLSPNASVDDNNSTRVLSRLMFQPPPSKVPRPTSTTKTQAPPQPQPQPPPQKTKLNTILSKESEEIDIRNPRTLPNQGFKNNNNNSTAGNRSKIDISPNLIRCVQDLNLGVHRLTEAIQHIDRTLRDCVSAQLQETEEKDNFNRSLNRNRVNNNNNNNNANNSGINNHSKNNNKNSLNNNNNNKNNSNLSSNNNHSNSSQSNNSIQAVSNSNNSGLVNTSSVIKVSNEVMLPTKSSLKKQSSIENDIDINIESVENEDNLNNHKRNNDISILQTWLESNVGLPQYFDTFVENGIENLEVVKNLTDNHLKEELAIDKIGHRILLQKEILKLRSNFQLLADSSSTTEMASIVIAATAVAASGAGV